VQTTANDRLLHVMGQLRPGRKARVRNDIASLYLKYSHSARAEDCSGSNRSVQRCPPHDRFSQGRTFAGAHGTAVSRQYPTWPRGPSPIQNNSDSSHRPHPAFCGRIFGRVLPWAGRR
jgi:hypothetical protein